MDDRAKCLKYRKEQCDECGSSENIEVHHVDGDRWNHSLHNLLPLCRSCHQNVHNYEPGYEHLSDQLELGPPGPEITEKEIDEAFADVDIITSR
jgi:5-methylcytosine-specific restriction endonuclease McrA